MVERLKILTEIDQQLTGWYEELSGRLQEVLEATAFSNRFLLPPRRLPHIAQAEAGAFLEFLKTGDADSVREQGAKRAEEGLGEQAMLRLGTTLTKFCRDHLADEALQAADVYADALLEGFMEGREAIVLREQEQIRRALQRVVSRYALQLATAAEVSRAASSILNPAKLLPEVVDLIRDRFNFYYVGLFIFDESGEYAVLRAGTGEAGRQMLEMGHKLEVGGTSMIGWCMAHSKARIALDVGKEAVRFENPLLPETRSEMALPLISRGRVIGAMTIQSTRPAAFSDEDITVLQTMADQVANGIENARLFAETRQRMQELAIVFNASQTLASTPLQPEEIAEVITQHFVKVMGIEEASVSLVDPEGIMHVLVDTYIGEGGIRRDMLQESFRLEDYPATVRVMETLQPLVVQASDPDADPAELAYMREYGVMTLVIIPLAVKARSIGVIELESSSRERHYTLEQLNLAVTLANEAAAALENARLFKEAQERAEELAALNTIASAVSRSLELKDLLQEALSEVISAMGFEAGLISLVDEMTGQLVLSVQSGLPGPLVSRLEEAGLGGTLCDFVFQTSEGLGLSDLRDSAPINVGGLLRHGIRSYLGAPLMHKERSLGTICVFSYSPQPLTAADFSLIGAIGQQVGVAVHNARLFEETQHRAVQLRVVNEVGRILTSILDVDPLLDHVVRLIRDTFDYYQVNLGLIEGDTLVPKAWAGALSTFPTEVARLNLDAEAIVTKVLTSGTPLLVPDVRQEPLYLPLPGLEEVRSELVVPLKYKDQVIGVLDVESDRPAAFDERDLMVLEALAGQIAVAIENARLFQETKASLEEITLLHQRYLQEAWGEFLEEETGRERAGYMYDRGTVSPASTVWRPEIGLAVQREDTIALSDMADALQGTVEEVGAILEASPTQSALAVPLKVRGQVIGALDFYETDQARDWSPEDIAMVEAVANQVALAVENARAYEELQKTAEQLKEIDRLKTQFLANMSHELRTPLNSIIGFSRVILKGIDGPINEQQRADLTSIYNNGQHLLGMINDILDISKIEAGKMELIFEPVDLRQIISGVMSTAIALVRDKPIELEQEVAPHLPIIRADGTRLRQVILNLLSNAAKFTEEGQITLRAWADEEQITVSVEDTGIGIPSEHQTTIFEEFRQVDASTTRRTGGTGLGLAISRHFVEMQGGRIWVESEPGVGSTFIFTLPITGPAPIAESEFADLTIDRSRKLILAVEDDEGAVSIYKRYLEKRGYKVVGLNQGEQALRWAQELSPYAIIMDVLLPGKDGWTVLEELKSSRETHQIPVIICTVIDDKEAHGLSLGAADYLVKPILEEDLLQSLQRLEERQRI